MKNVLITGAAKGIGRCMAENLAKEGYQVMVGYHTSEKEAEELKENLLKEGKVLHIYQADLSKAEEAKKLVEHTIKLFGNIDILINNAGIDQVKPFVEITDEDWKIMLDTNLSSVFYVTRETLKDMLHYKNGCVINISSVYGMIGGSCEVHYSISKAGIDGMTKALAKEMGLSHIRVNSIAPGCINTDMTRYLSEEEKKILTEEIPLQRMGEPIDIYRAAKWLIEDEYTTGQIISPNGGWTII